MKVLVPHNSNVMLDRLQQMLSSMEKVEVVGSFQNGTDALSAMHKLKPDLTVLDNKMSRLKRVNVIREIRKEDIRITNLKLV